MRIFSILIFVFAGLEAYSQEFVFHLYFSDAAGNRDTLAIGFDKNATDTIDAELGEVNIVHSQLHPEFDVRISNLWRNHGWDIGKDSFQTKRQIIENKCSGWFSPVTIDVFCKNWPVTIEWDSTLFKDSCVEGSLLTSYDPGGWFDVGGGFITQLGLASEMKIHIDQKGEFPTTQYYCKNAQKDTIYVFWLGFGDSELPRLSIGEKTLPDGFIFYPNPSNGLIYLKGDLTRVEVIHIYDLTGTNIATAAKGVVDMRKAKAGIYIAKIRLKGGGIINRRIVLNQFIP